MSNDLEWKEPPPELTRGRGKHDQAIEILKQKPGEWARVQKDMSSSGATQPWRQRGCEAVSRPASSGKEGKRDIYARWPLVVKTTTTSNTVDGVTEVRQDLEPARPPVRQNSRLAVRRKAILAEARQEPEEPPAVRLQEAGKLEQHRQPQKTWTINGVTRSDPPPEPLPIPEEETPAEARTRRGLDRMAMDRWKRAVPKDGKSPLAVSRAQG